MLRILLLSALALTLLFTATSCSKSITTASGLRHTPYTKFNFRLNNQNITRASVYKRYVAQNRNYKPFPAKGKNLKRNTTPKEDYVALKRN